MWQVQYFITAMDGVKMDLRAKDQVQPLVSDVMSSLNRCDFLGTAFDKSKLEGWYVREQGMGERVLLPLSGQRCECCAVCRLPSHVCLHPSFVPCCGDTEARRRESPGWSPRHDPWANR